MWLISYLLLDAVAWLHGSTDIISVSGYHLCKANNEPKVNVPQQIEKKSGSEEFILVSLFP